MCRLMAYIGQPSLLADIVLWPDRSIIKQSYDARERQGDPNLPFHLGHGNLNGDGFGIGWFCPDERRAQDPTPCTFTSITPAWNNDNLVRLACKVVSPLIFAHVRAAYPGMPVSEENCHPFQSGRYMWMHNGVVGGFHLIRRALLEKLSDTAFNSVQSFNSDSAVSFAVFLNHLPDLTNQQPPEVLLQAMQDTLATIAQVQKQYNIQETSLLNFVVSDGVTIVATRYVIPSDKTPPSLYYAEGSMFVRDPEAPHATDLPSPGNCSNRGAAALRSPRGGQDRSARPAHTTPLTTPQRMHTMNPLHEASYHLEYGERGPFAAFVASEPITGCKTDWVAIPKNNAVVITHGKGGVLCSLRATLDSQASSTEQQAELGRCLEAVSRGMLDKVSNAKSMRRTLSETYSSSMLNAELGPLDAGSQLVEQALHLLTGHESPVLTAIVDDHGNQLFTASVDGVIKVWDINSLACSYTIPGHRRPVTQLHLTSSHLYAIAGSTLRIWERTTYNHVYTLQTHRDWGLMRGITLGPRGIAYIAGQDSTIRAFSLDQSEFSQGSRTKDLADVVSEPDFCSPAGAGHVGAVNAVVMMSNGKYLASGGADAMVRVWKPQDLQPVKVLRGHRGAVLCLLAMGNLLLSGGRDNQIRVWDTEGPDMLCRRTLQGHRDDVTSLAAIRVRRPRCSLGPMGLVHSNTPIQSASPARVVHQLAFTLVASASADGTVRIWSTNWTCIRVLATPPASGPALSVEGVLQDMEQPAALSCAISERHVLVGYDDSHVRLWRCDDLYSAAQSQCLAELIRASNGSSDVSSSEDDHGEEEEEGLAGRDRGRNTSSSGSLVSQDLTTAPQDQDSDDYLLVPHTTMDDISDPNTPVHPGTPDKPTKPHGPQHTSPTKIAHFPDHPSPRASKSSPSLASASINIPPRQHPSTASSSINIPGRLHSSTASTRINIPAKEHSSTAPSNSPFHQVTTRTKSHYQQMSTPSKPTLLASSSGLPPTHPPYSSSAIDIKTGLVPLVTSGQLDDLPLKPSWGCSREPHRNRNAGQKTGPRFKNRYRKHPLLSQSNGMLLSPTVRRSVDYQLEECLREFVRIPTVSAEPNHREDCFRGAKYLCRLLETLGAEIKMARAIEDKNPVVIARLGQDPDRPTITFYGHYDVQPAHEPDWLTNPYELNAVDGYLYGRGTSDNKGPVLSFIFAVKELLEKRDQALQADKQLGINIVFVFEGEEENGSHGFRQAVQQNAHWFQNTQLIVISNTQWVGENKPCLTYGMRGMISLSVQVVGPEKDVHSGNDGGVFREPMSDLCKVLGSMVDPSNNSILVPGMYSGVKPGLLDLAWPGLEESDEFTVEAYQNSLGVPALCVSTNKREVLESRWCKPSLSVVDVRATVMNANESNYCYRFGPTRFSVIPKSAVGKLSLRFVAEQNAQELVDKIRAHVESEFAKLQSPNKVSVVVESIGDWWEADAGSELFKMAEQAISREWGVNPLYVREGGTMPVASALQKLLQSPVLVLPMGQSSDNCHLANERIRRVNLLKGKNVICHLLEEFERSSLQKTEQQQ